MNEFFHQSIVELELKTLNVGELSPKYRFKNFDGSSNISYQTNPLIVFFLSVCLSISHGDFVISMVLFYTKITLRL